MTDERIRIGPAEYVGGSPCPVCARQLSGASSVDVLPGDAPSPRPVPGDLTVCVYCGTWLAFTVDGLRLATDAEVRAVNPTLRRLPEVFAPPTKRRPS